MSLPSLQPDLPQTVIIFSATVSFLHLLLSSLPVPHALSSWWIIWNRIDPVNFPLPKTLSKYNGANDVWKTSLLVGWDNRQETSLGSAIHHAWDFISPVDRELMLFCWAKYHDDRIGFAHPRVSSNYIMAMLYSDFGTNSDLHWLFDRAHFLLSEIFK